MTPSGVAGARRGQGFSGVSGKAWLMLGRCQGGHGLKEVPLRRPLLALDRAVLGWGRG